MLNISRDKINVNNNREITNSSSNNKKKNSSNILSPLQEILTKDEYYNFIDSIIYLISRIDQLERSYSRSKSLSSNYNPGLSPRGDESLREIDISPRGGELSFLGDSPTKGRSGANDFGEIESPRKESNSQENDANPQENEISPRFANINNNNISLVTANSKDNQSQSLEINYEKLNENSENTNSTNQNNKTEKSIEKRDEEYRVLKSLKILLLRLDTCGDTLFSIYEKYPIISQGSEHIINKFFTLLLIFGSYKIGSCIASEKEVVYKAAAVLLS